MAAESAEQENLVAKIKATAGLILDEYLMTENGMDAASYVEELKAGDLKPEVVKRLLICALDKTEGEQEVAAGMISSLSGAAAEAARRPRAGRAQGGGLCGALRGAPAGGQDGAGVAAGIGAGAGGGAAGQAAAGVGEHESEAAAGDHNREAEGAGDHRG
eukprot:861475-Rhodomonas_salina.1